MTAIETFVIHGKDISSYQPVGNFGEGGRHFAIFKVSEGATWRDPHFAANRAAAHADPNIIAIGLYDFAQPAKVTPEAEFANFAAAVGKPRPGEFAVLDYEVAPWDQAWACRWADLAHLAGFSKVGFYTYTGMWKPNPHDVIPRHFDFGWIAGYGRSLPPMDGFAGGPTFWQHTDGQASVAGNDGTTDCNVFVPNSLDALRAWINSPAQPTPKEKPMYYLLGDTADTPVEKCRIGIFLGSHFNELADPIELSSVVYNLNHGLVPAQRVVKVTWDLCVKLNGPAAK